VDFHKICEIDRSWIREELTGIWKWFGRKWSEVKWSKIPHIAIARLCVEAGQCLWLRLYWYNGKYNINLPHLHARICKNQKGCTTWHHTDSTILLSVSLFSATSQYEVDVAYCYRRSSAHSLSVGLSVTIVNPAKTAEPIEIPLGLWTRVGPRNHVLERDPDPPWEVTISRGKGRPIVKYRTTDHVRRRCGLFVKLLLPLVWFLLSYLCDAATVVLANGFWANRYK